MLIHMYGTKGRHMIHIISLKLHMSRDGCCQCHHILEEVAILVTTYSSLRYQNPPFPLLTCFLSRVETKCLQIQSSKEHDTET